jgi:hypothetical protein
MPVAVALAFLLITTLGPAPRAVAEPLPLAARVFLGLPATEVQVRVESGGNETRIRVRTDRHAAEGVVAGATTEARVERVTLADGSAVGIIRAHGASTQVAALVVARRGRPSIAWSGRLDLRGDPGERTGDVLEVTDRTGDGHPDIVVAQVREGVAPCGQPPALLFPRALDPSSGELRPVVLRRLPAGLAEVALAATLQSPGPTGPPRVRGLRAVGASSTSGVPEDARALEPPFALTDGNPATFWAEGRGGAGEGELIVAHTGISLPIRALAITAPPASPGVRAPRTVLLVGDAAPALRVSLPDAVPPGARAWIVPPTPLAWSCVSLVLADRGGEPGVRTAIAEIELYTDLDWDGGIEELVAALVRDDEEGDRATELLGRLGEPALRALEEAWERLGPHGRERTIRVAAAVLRSSREAPLEAALALLSRAASDDRAEVRAAAIETLARAGARGRARLVELAVAPGIGGEDAAAALARSEDPFAIRPLLDALAAEEGSERPALREALGRGAALAIESARGDLERWATEAPVAARASAALALARAPETRPLARAMIESALGQAEAFADRFRLASAAASLEDPGETIDGWLASLATQADEWMLRRAALEAVARRRPEIARAALADRYPRVRVAAIEALAGSERDRAAIERAARTDPWPMVRVAALDALANREGSRALLRAAIGDDAQSVRRRAIEHLTRLGDREAWSVIDARLRDRDEWPGVIEAALGYVEALCVREAGEALHEVIRRGARPGAWEPDVEAAVRALRIALRLGAAIAEQARAIAGRGGEALRAALQRAAREPPAACIAARP